MPVLKGAGTITISTTSKGDNVKPATEAQIAELKSRGYYVEDMQEVWGNGWWNGKFRWMTAGGFGRPCRTVAEAWADCAHHVFTSTAERES